MTRHIGAKTIMISTATNRKLLASLLVSASLAACGGTPKQIDSLEQARTAYDQASADEGIVRHAPSELDEARQALRAADKIWRKKGDARRVEHYAYLTSQRVQIAELIAERKEADARLESMKLERQRVQLDLRSQEVDKARAETLALQRQLEEMQARNTERGIVLTLGDVLFDIDEATLKPGADVTIDRIAKFMRDYPERVVEIEGHTDSMGDEDYNMDLSRERAFTVRTALVRRGVDSSRITTKGFGEALPVASNQTATGRQENRRVEVIFPDVNTQVTEYNED